MALTNKTGIVTTGLTLRVLGTRAPRLLVSLTSGFLQLNIHNTQLIYDPAKYHTKTIK